MADTYFRDPANGNIYAFTATSWDHLTGPQWKDRVKEGARSTNVDGGIIFHLAKSRVPVKG